MGRYEKGQEEEAFAVPWLRMVGLVLVGLGVATGLWTMSIAYDVLFRPERVGLVSRLVASVDKTNELFRMVKTAEGVVWQGEGVRYAVILLLAIVVFHAMGAIVAGILSAGVKVLSLERPRGDEATESGRDGKRGKEVY